MSPNTKNIETIDLTEDTPPTSPTTSTKPTIKPSIKPAPRRPQSFKRSPSSSPSDSACEAPRGPQGINLDGPVGRFDLGLKRKHNNSKIDLPKATKVPKLSAPVESKPASIAESSLASTPVEVQDKASTPPTTSTAMPSTQAEEIERPVTPTFKDPKLTSTPAVADRFIPTYTSPTSPTHIRDPATFTVKPAYWRRWPQARYAALIEDLRAQFDPVPFARQHDISVEEVQHVLNATVVDPIYDEGEAVKAKAEKSMDIMFEDLKEKGTQMRGWGPEGKKTRGELDRIGKGFIMLVLQKGGAAGMNIAQLSQGDWKYLKETVEAEMVAMLKEEVVVEEVKKVNETKAESVVEDNNDDDGP